MPNMGDLTTNVTCDASQYQRGSDLAREANKQFGGSLDVIVGKLEAQKRAMENAKKTTQDNILGAASKGATEGEVNRALQLNEEVNALKARKAAEDQATAARENSVRVGQELTTGLAMEISLFGRTADEVQLYRAAVAGASEADIRLAKEKQDLLAAMRSETQANAALESEKQRAIQAGQQLTTGLAQQKAEFGMTAQQAELYRASLAGASAADIALAQGIQDDIAAMKAEKVAADAVIAANESAARAGKALNDSLAQEVTLFGKTTEEIQLHNAAVNGASAADIALAKEKQDLLAAMKAEKKAQDEATNATQRAKASGESLVAELQREKAEYGMTSAEVRRYRAAQAGASEADLKRAEVLEQEIVEMHRAKQAQNELTQATNKGTDASKTSGRGASILTASMQGLEDGIQGVSNNGFKGFTQAITNNVAQVGSLVGGTAGLAIGVGSIALLLSGTLLPLLVNWGAESEELKKKKEELAAASKKAFDAEVDQMVKLKNLQHDELVQKQQFERDKAKPRSSSELQEERERISREREGLGKQMDAEKIRQRELDKQKPKSVAYTNAVASNSISNLGHGLDFVLSPIFSEGYEEKARKQAQEARTAGDKERREKLKDSQTVFDDAERQAELLHNQQLDLDKQIAVAKMEEERKLRSESWIAQQELNLKKKALEDKLAKEKLGNEITAQKSFAGMIAGGIGQLSPELADERERANKRAEVEKARKSGLITDSEAFTVNRMNDTKPEQAAGNAAAIQAGSKEAYSAILRGMKAAENAKIMAEQRKLAEESKAILDKIEANTATKENKILVEFF